MKFGATRFEKEYLADILNDVFRHSTIKRIEAAIRGEKDPMEEAIEEERSK